MQVSTPSVLSIARRSGALAENGCISWQHVFGTLKAGGNVQLRHMLMKPNGRPESTDHAVSHGHRPTRWFEKREPCSL